MTRPIRITTLRLGSVAVLAALTAAALTASASAQATTTTINTVVPFSDVFPNPCTGENVMLTGNLHILIHMTENSAGGLEAKVHFQPQGVTGVGTSGTEYQGTGVTQDQTTDNPGPQFETTFINNFRIISHGASPNFTVHDIFHLTVNNNGDVTATVAVDRTECQG